MSWERQPPENQKALLNVRGDSILKVDAKELHLRSGLAHGRAVWLFP